MREKIHRQARLVPSPIEHPHARELLVMSEVLDALPDAASLVLADLARPGSKAGKGRKGMTAEQVLRAIVLKQMNGFSYDELAFHLADSSCYRWFCRIGIGDKAPTRSTLQKAIKRVRVETWEAINQLLVRHALALGIESGEKVRTDCTAIEANIHHPNDSSLLWDCIRVLARLMRDARDEFGLSFTDHHRRGQRRAQGISFKKSMKERLPLYRDLLKVTHATVRDAIRIATELGSVPAGSLMQMAKAQGIAWQLRHYVGLAEQVISQTERRVLHGESVPAADKILSIFEPHTDIIIKDNREPTYGHKVCLSSGPSGLVTDVVVLEGNPADVTLATEMIERHRELFGRAPRQVAFDGGFASRKNLADIKELGVEDVAFSKRLGLKITEMVKSSWVYRRLRDFRSGLEGGISFLKRVFGWERCTWSGFASFKAYVTASVFSCNLLLVARHLLPDDS